MGKAPWPEVHQRGHGQDIWDPADARVPGVPACDSWHRAVCVRPLRLHFGVLPEAVGIGVDRKV